ncbi:MAG: hypothetical protein GYA24_23585 [Candidatus Lokiarchaeota archaeon]|nr:hypothetical protein [Candidatus Lokiarchaeota archaeon]
MKTEFSTSSAEPASTPSFRHNVTIEIAGAAIFIGISAVVSAIITPILPRIPGWGIAIFDPISIIWITCFLIFGWRSGLICLAGGSVILFFFDPTGIGPFFKFFATLPFLAVPIAIYFISKATRKTEIDMKSWIFGVKVYGLSMIIAWGARILLMLWANWVMFTFLLAPHIINYVNLSFFGLPDIKAWDAVIIMAILINSWQSIFDVIIPYLITFKLVPKYMQIS